MEDKINILAEKLTRKTQELTQKQIEDNRIKVALCSH